MLHISRCALTKQITWYKPRVCISIQSKVIPKNNSGDLRWSFEGGTLPRISAFLSITFDWIETQTWEWHQNVCLAKAHRLICNITYLNHHVTLTWDDLRSNFEIDISRSSSICFEPARRENRIDVKIIALSLLLQNLFTTNCFHINRYFDLWWPL